MLQNIFGIKKERPNQRQFVIMQKKKQILAKASDWNPKRKVGVTMHFSEIIKQE